MPELIAEMKQDLSNPEHSSLREFFIVSKRVELDRSPKRLCYFLEDHPELQAKVSRLETEGYVVNIAQGETTVYRIAEVFADLVLNS